MSSPIDVCTGVGGLAACTVPLGRFEWVRLGAVQCRAVEKPKKPGGSHMTSFLPNEIGQITVCVRARQVARLQRLGCEVVAGLGLPFSPSKKSGNQARPITMRRREASGSNSRWYSPSQRHGHASKSEEEKKMKDQKNRLVCLG
jgi:hypothetical protein